MSRATLQCFLAVATIAVASPQPRCQPPKGWLAVSSLREPGGRPGPGGVWLVHPRDTSLPIQAITGLPAALTGVHPSSPSGANCIAWRPSDDALVAGEFGPANAMVGLHVLHLAGSTVVGAASHPVGTVASQYSGGVVAVTVLPNQDALFATFGLGPNGPLRGALLGRLVATSQTIVPYPVQFPASFAPGINALAVDAAGQNAYIANHLGGPNMDIYRVPLGQTNPVATWLVRIGTLVSAMALDPTDRWLTAVGFSGASNVWQIDTQGPIVSRQCPGGSVGYNGIALEEHTGQLVALGQTTGIYNALLMNAACGMETPLVAPPAAGWGVSSGIVEIRSLRPYGAPTANANLYTWRTRPNPSGLPVVGNALFSVIVQGSPQATSGVVAIAQARLPAPVRLLGVDLWIDPTRVLVVAPLVLTGQSALLPLPIPNVVGLRQASLWLQTLHVTGQPATPLDASAGLELVMF